MTRIGPMQGPQAQQPPPGQPQSLGSESVNPVLRPLSAGGALLGPAQAQALRPPGQGMPQLPQQQQPEPRSLPPQYGGMAKPGFPSQHQRTYGEWRSWDSQFIAITCLYLDQCLGKHFVINPLWSLGLRTGWAECLPEPGVQRCIACEAVGICAGGPAQLRAGQHLPPRYQMPQDPRFQNLSGQYRLPQPLPQQQQQQQLLQRQRALQQPPMAPDQAMGLLHPGLHAHQQERWNAYDHHMALLQLQQQQGAAYDASDEAQLAELQGVPLGSLGSLSSDALINLQALVCSYLTPGFPLSSVLEPSTLNRSQSTTVLPVQSLKKGNKTWACWPQ